jgi:hypothetical protein
VGWIAIVALVVLAFNSVALPRFRDWKYQREQKRRQKQKDAELEKQKARAAEEGAGNTGSALPEGVPEAPPDPVEANSAGNPHAARISEINKIKFYLGLLEGSGRNDTTIYKTISSFCSGLVRQHRLGGRGGDADEYERIVERVKAIVKCADNGHVTDAVCHDFKSRLRRLIAALEASTPGKSRPSNARPNMPVDLSQVGQRTVTSPDNDSQLQGYGSALHRGQTTLGAGLQDGASREDRKTGAARSDNELGELRQRLAILEDEKRLASDQLAFELQAERERAEVPYLALTDYDHITVALAAELTDLPPTLQAFARDLLEIAEQLSDGDLVRLTTDSGLARIDSTIFRPPPVFAGAISPEKIDFLRDAYLRIVSLQASMPKTLADRGLTVINPETGTVYDTNRHASQSDDLMWINDDPARNNKIAAVKRIGYALDGKVIRKAEVKRFVFRADRGSTAGIDLDPMTPVSSMATPGSTRPNSQSTPATQRAEPPSAPIAASDSAQTVNSAASASSQLNTDGGDKGSGTPVTPQGAGNTTAPTAVNDAGSQAAVPSDVQPTPPTNDVREKPVTTPTIVTPVHDAEDDALKNQLFGDSG